MGVGKAGKHLFLLLFLALFFAPLSHACMGPEADCSVASGNVCCSTLQCEDWGEGPVCKQKLNQPCPNGDEDCASAYACRDGLCKQGYGGSCDIANGDADCGGSLFCRDGHCLGCVCEDYAYCGSPCSAGLECCSQSCNGNCVSCLGAGDDCSSGMGACCNGLTCSSSDNICTDNSSSSTPGDWASGIYMWTALAVIMAAAFLGLAYMAGKLFEIAVLDAWVRIELAELVKSMIIAVFCISLIATVDVAAQFLVGDDAPGVIPAAQQFMQTLYSDGDKLYTNLAVAYFNIAKVASYSYTAGTSLGGLASISYSNSPASGLSPLVSELGQSLDSVANYMLLAAAQAAFLQFFGTASLVMLPIGIFLRSFSFTRKVGGTLLAATIAAAVIYPASVLLSGEVYKTFSPDFMDTVENVKVKDAQNPPMTSVVCNPAAQYIVQSPLPFLGGEIGWWVVACTPFCAVSAILGGAFFACMFNCYNIIGYIFTLLRAIFPIIIFISVFITMDTSTSAPKLINDYYVPLRDYAMPAVAKFSVVSLVTFLIPLIITMSLLRNLSTAFGGEPHLYGLSKLV